MNSKKIEKMYKNKQVRLYLARELVFLEIGEKIPPMLELSKKYKISVGMIQKVFTDFQNESIIKCNKRGVLGSYIECIDNDKLLEESDFEYLIGVMSLPYSKKYEGLVKNRSF